MKRSLSTLIVFVFTSALLLEASPRRTRDYQAERQTESDAEVKLAMQQDAVAREEEDLAAIIRESTAEQESLVNRRQGETLTQYRERLEAAVERMQIDDERSESLQESQREAVYKAFYTMRRQTFAGSHSPYGQGAGPVGDRYAAPIDLSDVFTFLFTDEGAPAAEQNENLEAPPQE